MNEPRRVRFKAPTAVQDVWNAVSIGPGFVGLGKPDDYTVAVVPEGWVEDVEGAQQ